MDAFQAKLYNFCEIQGYVHGCLPQSMCTAGPFSSSFAACEVKPTVSHTIHIGSSGRPTGVLNVACFHAKMAPGFSGSPERATGVLKEFFVSEKRKRSTVCWKP